MFQVFFLSLYGNGALVSAISADKATNLHSSFGGGAVHLSHLVTLWWYTLVMTVQSVLVNLHHSN